MAMSAKSQSVLLTEGNYSLCSKVYAAVKDIKGNIFYSPASLEIALTLLYTGTDGNTAKEIQSVLHLPESSKINAAVHDTLTELTQSKNVTLHIANGLFLQRNFKIHKNFVDVAKKFFSSDVTNVHFGDPETVRILNSYVAEATNQKINELFSQDSFDQMTRLVIANAIYFKGNWAKKFDPSITYKGDFHLNEKDKVSVDFMKMEEKFETGYIEELKANVVVLPYEGQDMKMILVVPDDIHGLKQLEDKIVNMNLVELAKRTYSQKIILAMPKFKLEETLKLKDILCQIGMAEMFSDRANLSGIADDPLYVSDIVQKSFIEVNEEGAEAASATGVVVNMRMMPLPPIEIKLNLPFLFYILAHSKTTLFMGRVSRPST